MYTVSSSLWGLLRHHSNTTVNIHQHISCYLLTTFSWPTHTYTGKQQLTTISVHYYMHSVHGLHASPCPLKWVTCENDLWRCVGKGGEGEAARQRDKRGNQCFWAWGKKTNLAIQQEISHPTRNFISIHDDRITIVTIHENQKTL